MKKTLFALAAAIALSGCSTPGQALFKNPSAIQNYRPANSSEPVKISGSLDKIYADKKYSTTHQLSVYFNDSLTIQGLVDSNGNAEIPGKWNDKSVSSLCTGAQNRPDWIDVRCIIFIENERTVTLSF